MVFKSVLPFSKNIVFVVVTVVFVAVSVELVIFERFVLIAFKIFDAVILLVDTDVLGMTCGFFGCSIRNSRHVFFFYIKHKIIKCQNEKIKVK